MNDTVLYINSAIPFFAQNAIQINHIIGILDQEVPLFLHPISTLEGKSDAITKKPLNAKNVNFSYWAH